MKKIPQWVKDREALAQPHEEVTFVGEMGVDAVVDGKLPNGESYVYHRRDKKSRGRRRR
jgi:hypothetical protein